MSGTLKRAILQAACGLLLLAASTDALQAATKRSAKPVAAAKKTPVRKSASATVTPRSKATRAKAVAASSTKRTATVSKKTATRTQRLRNSSSGRRRISTVRRRPVPRFIYAAMVSPDPATFPEMVPPVADLAPAELQDTYYSFRSGYRAHRAIDISRVTGTPLVAVVDGFVEKMTTSPLGGTCLYIVDAERRYRFFYAHLSEYAEELTEGMPVLRGQVVGFVGNTGNARFTGPHLHFQILVTDPNGGWSSDLGTVNPYPVLRELVASGTQATISKLTPAGPAPFVAPELIAQVPETPAAFALPVTVDAGGQN